MDSGSKVSHTYWWAFGSFFKYLGGKRSLDQCQIHIKMLPYNFDSTYYFAMALYLLFGCGGSNYETIWIYFDCNVCLPNNRLEGHISYLVLVLNTGTGTVHVVDCLLVNCLYNNIHICRFVSNIFI